MIHKMAVTADAPYEIPARENPPAATLTTRETVAFITYFRAFAIVMIVTGHCYALAWTHGIAEDPTGSHSIFNTLPALVNGGTALFVFISGFLYRQVFYGRVPLGEFMRRKVLYVGLPYFVIASPLALLEIWTGTFSVTMTKEGVAYAESYFIDYVSLITTGRMVTAYWYIPCAFLLFAASPLFDRFIRMKPSWRWAILAASFAVAMWVHRPMDNLNPLQSLVYFVNVYLFGILFCEYRRPIMAALAEPRILFQLSLIAVLLAATQAVVLGRIDNIERNHIDGWLPIGLDLMLLQKYALIFAMCGLLEKYGHLAHRPLEYLAGISFGVFFAHGPVLALMMRLPDSATPHFGNPFADLIFYAALVLALSIAAVTVIRALTGRYSRYVIGC